jgi:hypothetical protein
MPTRAECPFSVTDRRCSGSTRNQRLATIHSLARFIGANRWDGRAPIA